MSARSLAGAMPQAGGQVRGRVRAERAGREASRASFPAEASSSERALAREGEKARAAGGGGAPAAEVEVLATLKVRDFIPHTPLAISAGRHTLASEGVVMLRRLVGAPGALRAQFTAAGTPFMSRVVRLGRKEGRAEKGCSAGPTSTRCVELERVRVSQEAGVGGRRDTVERDAAAALALA